MPRRRPSRKAKSHSKPRPVDRKDGALKRWNTRDDIELDEEDQFHASRDKILLEDGDGEDEEGDEEEVFALRGLSDDDGDDDAEYLSDEADETHESDGMDVDADADPDLEPTPSKSKPSKSARDTKSSSKRDKHASESEEETWGRSKGAYYSSNAAQLDSDDEEANELEEQEALRLQAKAREGMCDDDFGLGDVVEGDDEPPEAIAEEVLPKPVLIKPLQDRQTVIRTLEKESPESLALARDWDDTAHNLVEAKARVDALEETEPDALERGLQHLYYQALLTYTTTLAFYLHLRVTEKYAARPELLRRHPILNRLLTLKQGIHTLESLGVGQPLTDADEDDGSEDDADEDDLTDGSEDSGDLWSHIQQNGLESGELAALLEDAAALTATPPTRPKKIKLRLAPEIECPKKKPKTAAAHGSDQPVFDLVEPAYVRAPPTEKHKHKHKTVGSVDTVAAVDPYGEMTALGYHDLSDKRARKKSLRFHVSRIESASSRRTNARANAAGGDDDIPYKERRKEREARLEKERDKRRDKGQLGDGGDDLDDVDPETRAVDKNHKRKRELEDEDAGEDAGDTNGYYDLVRQASATKKARKKAEYEAANARPELEPENTSGPRSVTRAILKNKGLTPRRSKAVRNPRVKKRQKYDQAKKKVASQKAVYKGGIGDVSKYSGEQSGISKVVKSVRL